jgi:hypothetical protein
MKQIKEEQFCLKRKRTASIYLAATKATTNKIRSLQKGELHKGKTSNQTT